MHMHMAGGRRRSRRYGTAFGFAGLAALVAAIGTSGCHDRHHRHGRWDERSATRRIDRALDWLDLEGDARERARVVAQRLAGEATAIRADATRLADEALAQWARSDPDAAALHRTLDEQLEDLRRRAHRVVDDVLELHATLDEEQRAQVGDALASHERRRHRDHRW